MNRSIFLAIAVAVAGCGDNLGAAGPDALTLDAPTTALKVGESTQVSATFRRRGSAVSGGSVTWASSDPTRATVSGTGDSATITAIAAGAATITASGQGLLATLPVSVSPASLLQIAIAPPSPSIPAGTTMTMTAVATYSDRSTADITPGVTWTTDDAAIASFTGNVLTGVVPGHTTVSATFQGLSSSTQVAVTDPVLRSIEVRPPTPAVVVTVTQQFTATGHYSDSSTRDLTGTAAWASSMTGIATIADGGLATAVAVGTTTISATSDGITGTTTLGVEASALVSIAVMPDTPDIAVLSDQPFTAIGRFSDGTMTDITPTVAWSSSSEAIATIGSDGVASTLAVGPTTITAQRGAISGATLAHVILPDVGAWLPAPGFSGTPCHDGVKFSMAADLVYVCTTAAGVLRGAVAADTSIVFAPANVGVDSLSGLAIAAHPQNPSSVMYMSAPSGSAHNWFRSSDGALTFAASPLLDSAGQARFLYAGRFQPGGIGNMLGSWDPGGGTPQAIVLTGTTANMVHTVATATGTVRAFAGAASGGASLYAAVLGETPAGGPATGGVFHSTNSAATWTEMDTGIAAADRDQIVTLVNDPVNLMNLYAGVRSSGRIYKTSDGGATWTASATGIPARARLAVLLVSPQDPATVFAATDRGLYKSGDAGAHWVLAGFPGRAVTGIAQSSAAASLVLVAVDDGVGLYRAQ